MRVLRGGLLLLVLVCIASVGVWIVHGDGPPPPGVEVAAPVAEAPAARDARDRVIHLRVLNGTPEAGLASDVSLRLDRAGCVADRVANAPHDRFARTLLVNRRLDDDRAAALAARLGDLPLLREWDDRAAEDAVLVLGADHARVAAALTGR